MEAVLALDLGSTQLKLMLMDRNGGVLGTVTEGYPTLAPQAGWLEQRPEDWAAALEKGMERLRALRPEAEIVSVGFSGHMSGAVILDGEGSVLHPCIMLSDSRSDQECAELNERAGSLIREHTGNPVINAFTLPKLKWLQRHRREAWEKTSVWVSPKDYLRFLLTGRLATECTDAFNTIAVDAVTADWCPEILEAAGLEREKFPEMLTPDAAAGTVTRAAAARFFLPEGVPVAAGGADMACGALGMGLFEEGESALTLGTCATFLANVPGISGEGFGKVTFHLHALPGMYYALGSHFNGGLAVNWLASVLSPETKVDYGEIAALSEAASSVPPGSNGLLTIPFLAGSGSPNFAASDRQTVLGLSAASTRAEIFRSELEGITVNLDETRELFEKMIPGGLKRILLGGGGARIGVWPQMIADVFGTGIDVALNADASTVGAGILGGVASGFYTDAREIAKKCLSVSRSLSPDPASREAYRAVRGRWLEAYALTREWYQKQNRS